MEQELENLMMEIYDTPAGSVRIELLGRAINIADLLNDKETAYDLRNDLVNDCVFHGYGKKALSAFSWCLSELDKSKDNEWLDVYDVLWQYKWICTLIPSFYNIDLKQIHDICSDFRKRLLENGYSQYAYNYLMMINSLEFKDLDKAKEFHDKFIKMKRDAMSDCKACVQDGLVAYAIDSDDYPLALKYFEPIRQKKMSCGEVPHITYATMVLPAYLNGDMNTAKECYEKGYKISKNNAEFLSSIGDYMSYAALVVPEDGINMFQKHLNWFFNPYAKDQAKRDFAMGAALLMKKMISSRKEIKMNLPKEFALFEETGVYNSEKIYNYFYDYALDISNKFDERNQNDGYKKQLEKIINL